MTQEKLEQRALRFALDVGWPSSPSRLMQEFAKSELQKAADIVQSYGGLQSNMVAEKIRKLME